MKKIEEQIVEAFDLAKHNLSDGGRLSTRDSIDNSRAFHAVYYYLNDNCIFKYDTLFKLFTFSLRGYNTVTIRNRLKALLRYFCNSDLFMQQGKVYIITPDGEKTEIDPDIVYAIHAKDIIK